MTTSRVVVAGKQVLASGATALEQYGKSALVRAAVVLERAVNEQSATGKIMVKLADGGERMLGATWRAEAIVQHHAEPAMKARDFVRQQMSERGRPVELGLTGSRSHVNQVTLNSAIREARFAHFTAYDAAVLEGKSATEASRAGRAAFNAKLNETGVRLNEVAGAQVERAAQRLEQLADAPQSVRAVGVEEVKRRVATNAPPGEYVVRVVWNGHVTAEGKAMGAQMTRNEKAWFAPMNEIEGLKLNEGKVLDAIGFDKAEVKAAVKRGVEGAGGEYSVMVFRTADLRGVRLAVKENLIAEARMHPRLAAYKNAAPEFWERVMKFDYKSEFEKMKQQGIPLDKAEKYAKQLKPEDAELFTVRAELHLRFGANENYGGKGITLSPDDGQSVKAKAGEANSTSIRLTKEQQEEQRMRVREFFVDNEYLGDVVPHAIIPLRP